MTISYPGPDPKHGEAARKLLQISANYAQGDHWLAALEEASPRVLVAVIGGLAFQAERVSRNVLEGHREAARAMVEVKLTEQLVEQMDRLERVSTRLARAAVWLGVGGLVFAAASLGLAAVQVWFAWGGQS